MTPGDQDDIDRRLRPYVPELLLGWPDDVPWQELDGSLVSADISGFTALSERLAVKGREGAEELNHLISDCFTGMIDDCLGRGGDVIKFGGDALLVWFAGDGHARRAVSAALAMRATIRNERRTSDGRRVALSISIGVNSGVHHVVRIVASVPDLVVVGPGATATVQAESDADAGMVLVTPSTAALLPTDWIGAPHGCGVVVRRRLPDVADRHMDRPTDGAPAARFVTPEQQDAILAGITNEHRQVAVSFLAFGGTDELIAEGRIGDVAARLQRLAGSVARANDANGTYLLATDIAPDGGKFIVAAGAPLALGSNEDRLLRTIRSVVDDDPGLELHAGIHRGPLFAGDLGSHRRRVYTTLGDSMNLAARLSAKAAPGQIVVSRATMEWSSVEFAVEPLPPFHVKGKSQPIHAGLLGDHIGRRVEGFRVDGPLVGRAQALDRLRRLVADSRAGVSTGVAVVGEPGVGTSRLLAELATTTDTRVIAVRCSVLDRIHGRSAAADVVRALLDLPVEATEEVIDRLTRIGADRFPRSVPLLPLIGPVVGVQLDDTTESARVPPSLRASRAAQLLVQIVSALVEAPTLLVIDDIDHADDVSRQMATLLCSAGVDVPLCTVVSARPGDIGDAEELELGPLTDEELAQLVDELVGDGEVAADALRDVVSRSAGNPMIATELVAALLDGVGGVPESLDAAIEMRLDRLDASDRQVLRTAAVLGMDVEIAELAELVGTQVLADHARWDRLSEFLERTGPGSVRFRFDAHRRVAYEALPFRVRRQLHGAVLARLLASADGGRDHLVAVAHHAAAAGDERRTWDAATAAAAAFADTGSFGDAAAMYRMAWAARRAADPAEVAAVAEAAAKALNIAGDTAAAIDVLARALPLCDRPVDRARLLRHRGDVAEHEGGPAASRRWYGRAARELKRVGWATALVEQAQLDAARSGLAFRQGQFDEAWRYANLALAQAERAGHWETAAHAALMVDNLVTQMAWSGAVVSRPDVLGLHERAGDYLGAARWLSNQAVDRYYDGDWDDAVTMYQESAEQCARFGHLLSEATALNNIAEIHSDRGNYDDARALFRNARRSWRAIAYAVGIALVQANLGRLATRLGDDGAVDLLTDSIGRFDALAMGSMGADARLRLIEHHLVRGGTVRDEWWPDDISTEGDPVVELYRDRLQAVMAVRDGDTAAAAERAEHTVSEARAVGVPFELSLALRVQRAVTGDASLDAEIDRLHRRLGIITPPPVVPADVNG